MTIDTWLTIVAISLPLIGALTIWRGWVKVPDAHRLLAVCIFGSIGLIALSLFVIHRYYACIYVFGKQNCLFDGLATLSLFFLSLILARGCIVLRGENRSYDYTLMLLLSSAWAGMGLAENLLVFLIFFYLFYFVLNRWITRKGFKGGFLKVRDDYNDDQK